MATLSEIRDAVISVLNDDSIDEETIDKFINAGYKFCARRVLLPALESAGDVTTVPLISEVPIPTSWRFDRNLYAAAISDNPTIKILNSIALLRTKYPRFGTEILNGDIEFIVLRGANLIYYPVPRTEKTITCAFYKRTTPLVNDNDEPVALSPADQEDLLASYALWKIWARIEDGIEGQKVNTAYYKGEFFTIYNSIDTTITVGQSQPEPDRTSSWI